MPNRPVDRAYQLLPTQRAAIRRAMRLHDFHRRCAPIDGALAGRWQPERELRPGLWQWSLHQPRRTRLPAHAHLDLPSLPSWAGGAIAAAVEASSPTRTLIHGEPLRRLRLADCCLRPPLQGSLTLTTGRRRTTLDALRLWTYAPAPGELLDRYPVHQPVEVDQTCGVTLVPWRAGQRIEQVTWHWGSVEYRIPHLGLPLGAWGYPYYRDGVLADLFAVRGRLRRRLARNKFLEFDEVENLHDLRAVTADRLEVELFGRDPRVKQPTCRIASLEVRYRDELRRRGRRHELGRWVRPGHRLPLPPPAGPLLRLGVRWRDRGPAFGRLVTALARSRWANVCSGETRAFTYFHDLPTAGLALEAINAPLFVEAVFYVTAPGR